MGGPSGTGEPSARRATWWRTVADAIAERDPWAGGVEPVPALTDDQRAVLAGLADQPAVPRLGGMADQVGPGDQTPVPRLSVNGSEGEPGVVTGSSPGDGGDGPPYGQDTEEE